MAASSVIDPGMSSGINSQGMGIASDTTNQFTAPIGGMFKGFADQFGLTSHFAASEAPIKAGTDQQQLNENYNQSQNALAQQQAFLNALNAQNGIGNQMSVYNQQQQIANGQGPNPAMAALNQATGRNINSQAALMAGQRGAGANAGLLARQAAQQGAATQQQAVGQGATLQAQQSLAAINNLQNLATQQVVQQGNALNVYNQGTQNEQQILQNANNAYNNALVNMQSNMNNVNSATAQGNQSTMSNLMGGLMSGGGALASLFARGGMVKHYDDGGAVEGSDKEADEDDTPPQPAPPQEDKMQDMNLDPSKMQESNVSVPQIQAPNVAQPQSMVGQFLNGYNANSMAQSSSQFDPGNPNTSIKQKDMSSSGGGGGGGGGGMAMLAMLNKGGKVPAKVSPGEVYLKPDAVKQVAKGKAEPLSSGEKIPGKAKVKGDSLKNDVVDRNLDEGGIVIPRSVLQSKNPSAAAAKFVMETLRKQGKH